jgi:hypothetical protein
MQFLVGKFTCEMSLDDNGKVVTRWFLSDGRGADAPKYLNRAERKQYQAGREGFMESLEDHPSTLRQTQDAQEQRPRRKEQGRDGTTKTSIIFTVAVAAIASGLIGGATAA